MIIYYTTCFQNLSSRFFVQNIFLMYNLVMKKMTLEQINELISDKKFEEAQNSLKELLHDDEKNIEALKLSGLCNVNLEKCSKIQA